MRAVHEKVNIVPVIAKADTLTPAEVQKTKGKVRWWGEEGREGGTEGGEQCGDRNAGLDDESGWQNTERGGDPYPLCPPHPPPVWDGLGRCEASCS